MLLPEREVIRIKFSSYMRISLSIVIGAVLFAAGMNLFLLPSGIVLGGMTGIATVIYLFYEIPVGISTLLLNLPLIFLNMRRLGRTFAVRTVIGVAATSAASDYLPMCPIAAPPMLAAILGGAMVGFSVGILLGQGFTTGGTDLVALLMRNVMPGLTLGTAIMLADSVIILGAAWLTGNYGGILHSIVCALSAGICTDAALRLCRK